MRKHLIATAILLAAICASTSGCVSTKGPAKAGAWVGQQVATPIGFVTTAADEALSQTEDVLLEDLALEEDDSLGEGLLGLAAGTAATVYVNPARVLFSMATTAPKLVVPMTRGIVVLVADLTQEAVEETVDYWKEELVKDSAPEMNEGSSHNKRTKNGEEDEENPNH